MPNVPVEFTVKESTGVESSWIAVNDDRVPIGADGKGTIYLEPDAKHVLIWHFQGDPGSSISIKGMQGDATVVEVKKSTIPPGQTRLGNAKRFRTLP